MTSGVASMTLSDVPSPSPGAGEVVIELALAALNPADRYLALAQYPAKPPLPHVLGRDGVGRVVAVGKGVTGVKPGDIRAIMRSAVGVSRWGTLAQQVAVEANYTVPIPPGWTPEQAAAAPLVYLTAWQALTQWPDMPPESTGRVVLVTGATGGVGVASIQLAHALGHTVIGLSRSAAKSQRLRTLPGGGANFTFNPEDTTGTHWRKQLKDALGDRRVDLAIDNIGGALFSEVVDSMAMAGRVSCVGRLAGPVPSFNTASLFFRRVRIGGVAVATYSNEQSRDAWQRLLEVLARTGAAPIIDHVFPFDDVQAAFARLEAGPMGKVLVRIGAPSGLNLHSPVAGSSG